MVFIKLLCRVNFKKQIGSSPLARNRTNISSKGSIESHTFKWSPGLVLPISILPTAVISLPPAKYVQAFQPKATSRENKIYLARISRISHPPVA